MDFQWERFFQKEVGLCAPYVYTFKDQANWNDSKQQQVRIYGQVRAGRSSFYESGALAIHVSHCYRWSVQTAGSSTRPASPGAYGGWLAHGGVAAVTGRLFLACSAGGHSSLGQPRLGWEPHSWVPRGRRAIMYLELGFWSPVLDLQPRLQDFCFFLNCTRYLRMINVQGEDPRRH